MTYEQPPAHNTPGEHAPQDDGEQGYIDRLERQLRQESEHRLLPLMCRKASALVTVLCLTLAFTFWLVFRDRAPW